MGIAAGYLADRLLGDPARMHPVAGFGRLAEAVEARLWRESRAAGATYVVVLLFPVVATVGAIERMLAPSARGVFAATVLWATLGGRSLERAALAVAASDVERGRRLVIALAGRDPAELDADGLRRAAVESLAENTSDAVVAPLLWAALLGPAGAAAYRAVNTMDAMVGHRTARHQRFGWAAARLDDAASWPAARLTALLAIACAPLVGGRRDAAWEAAWHDGARHPSPNAGRVEGAFAGALSVRLGGPTVYAHGVEQRPWLGRGRQPQAIDVARAARLARAVSLAAVALCVPLGRRR